MTKIPKPKTPTSGASGVRLVGDIPRGAARANCRVVPVHSGASGIERVLLACNTSKLSLRQFWHFWHFQTWGASLVVQLSVVSTRILDRLLLNLM
jgi:hypothetical protein